MSFKPGDILHRKFSDSEDLYCVICIQHNYYAPDVTIVKMLPFYQTARGVLYTESQTSVENWYNIVDLNNYQTKQRFLNKIKSYLDEHLGQPLNYEGIILDNLLYIEILAELRKYETPDINKAEQP